MARFSRTMGWGQQKPPPGTPINWGDPINTGLVGCWLLGDGGGLRTIDSARLNHGTLTNFGASSTSGWNPGKFGTALAFDGTDDFILVSSNIVGKLLYTSANVKKFGLTQSCWFRANLTLSTNRFALIGGMNAPANSDWSGGGIDINDGSGTNQISFAIYDGATYPKITVNSALVNKKWHHVAGVVDIGAALIILYLDGVKIGTAAYAVAGSGLDPTYFEIGRRPKPDYYNSGLIDIPKVWNRTLQQSEISRIISEPFAGFAVPMRRVFPSAVAAGGGFKPPRQSLWIPGRGTIIQSSYNQCQI